MKSELKAASVVLAVALTGGCKDREAVSPPAPVPSPTERAVLRPPFVAPADGRLTAEQVRDYVEVRRRAARADGEERAQPDQPASLITSAAVEQRLAAELGIEPVEHRFVRERVAEALSGHLGTAAASLGVAGLDTADVLRASQAIRKEVTGEHAPEAAASATASEEARAWNRRLVEPFRTELLTLPRS